MSANLDARLLRYRNDPLCEDPKHLARDLLSDDRAGDAQEVLQTALNGKDDPELLVESGKVWLHEGDLLRAQRAFLQAARARPDMTEAFRWMGEVLLKRGDPNRAKKVLERALSLDASDRDVVRLHQRALRLSRSPASDGDALSEASPAIRQALEEKQLAVGFEDGEEDEDEPTSLMTRGKFAELLADKSSYRMGAPSPFADRSKTRRYEDPVDEEPAVRDQGGKATLHGVPFSADQLAKETSKLKDEGEAKKPSKPSKPKRTGTKRTLLSGPPPLSAKKTSVPPPPPSSKRPRLATKPPTEQRKTRVSNPPPPSLPPKPPTSIRKTERSEVPPPSVPPKQPPLRKTALSGPPPPPPPPEGVKSEKKTEEGLPSTRLNLGLAPEIPGASRLPSSAGAFGSSSASSSGELSSPSDIFGPPPEPPAGSFSSSGEQAALSSPGSVPSPKSSAGSLSSPGSVPSPKSSAGSLSSSGALSSPSSAGAVGDIPDLFSDVRPDDPFAKPPGRSLDEIITSSGFDSVGGTKSEASKSDVPKLDVSKLDDEPKIDVEFDVDLEEGAFDPTVPGDVPAIDTVPGDVPADMDAATTPGDVPAMVTTEEMALSLDDALAIETGDAKREDPDRVLALVQEEGFEESPDDDPSLASDEEVLAEREKAGTQTGTSWLFLAVVAAGIAVVGFLGYRSYQDHRRATVGGLVEDARDAILRGDHVDLDAAEESLERAAIIRPEQAEEAALRLALTTQRVLDEGMDASALRVMLSRMEGLSVAPELIDAAEAVVAYEAGDLETARRERQASLAGSFDEHALYAIGRAELDHDPEQARDHLQMAFTREPAHAPAAIAKALFKLDAGQEDEAAAALAPVMTRYANHVRANALSAYLSAAEQPDSTLSKVDEMSEALEQATPTDRAFAILARARANVAKGERVAAQQAIVAAVELNLEDRRLSRLLAVEADRAGLPTRALAAADRARIEGRPDRALSLLRARAQLAQNDPHAAIRTLSDLPAGDLSALKLTAEAALLAEDREAIERARGALGSAVNATDEPDAELRALLVRTQVVLDPAAALQDARQLVESDESEGALRALTEAALAASDAEQAIGAAARLVAATPDDAGAQCLLARAQRMAGRVDESEANFRRVLSLDEGHVDGILGLGLLLIDRGKLTEADEVLQSLSERDDAAGLAARTGRITALSLHGDLDGARALADALTDPQKAQRSVKLAIVQFALADARPADAITVITELGPEGDAELLTLLGQAHYEAGSIVEARGIYERAMAADAEYPEAMLGYAEVLVRSGRAREAKASLDRAEQALENRARPASVRGRLFMLRGRASLELRNRREARGLLERATGYEGTPPETWFYLGESLSGVNSPEARAAYQRYLEISPAGPLAERARRAIAR